MGLSGSVTGVLHLLEDVVKEKVDGVLLLHIYFYEGIRIKLLNSYPTDRLSTQQKVTCTIERRIWQHVSYEKSFA